MKELEELTREIREKLPRLTELCVGCVFCYPTSEDVSYIITQEDMEMVSFNRVEVFSQPRVEFKSIIQETRLIIGKEPMLNDVLEWLGEDYAMFIYHFHDTGLKGVFYNTDTGMFEHSWNLSKAFLKDQSPELIKFLHSLIKTKQ